jgi:dTDP-4-dehydrorhamnose reductase
LSKALDQCKPDVLINLIAKADVDGCEKDPVAAYVANVGVVGVIASAIDQRGIHLIHLSSDHLYDGPGPSNEDMARPLNVYAKTKFEGESVALAVGATVLRTNFVGRSVVPGRRSLSDWVVGCLRNGVPFTVFRDVLFSPLHVSTVCHCIERVAAKNCSGIYNLGARGGVSKAEFATVLADLLKANRAKMVVGNYFDVPQAVLRPRDMTMAVDKFETTFDYMLPRIENQIELLADEYPIS